MTLGGKTPQTGKAFVATVRQVFGSLSSRVGADGHHVAVNDIAAGDAEPAADRLKNNDQIGVQAAVASHVNAEVVAK